ncbi:MAG: hypothetical protein U5L72_12700 [Bacteroidales bacterium]|nr:hypothetical protein [Bacteroidales bacterium]
MPGLLPDQLRVVLPLKRSTAWLYSLNSPPTANVSNSIKRYSSTLLMLSILNMVFSAATTHASATNT